MEGLPVTIVANGFQPYYVTDYVNGLAHNGLKVDLLCSDIYDKAKMDPSINFINMRGSHDPDAPLAHKLSRVIRYYLRLLAYSSRTENRVYHIQWFRFNFFEGVVINLLLKLMGKRIVYTAHNVLPHMQENTYNRAVFFLIYHIADKIVAHTEFIRKRIVDEFGVPADKVAVVKHGVYNARDEASLDRRKARRLLGLAPDDKVVLFFGNITRYKGLDVLIPAVMRSRKAIPGLKLIVAGKVSDSYQDEFDRLIHPASPDEGVLPMPGFVPDDRVEALFKASDVTVLPYLEASQSGVLLLSYAYGRPVIAPDIGSFRHDVIEGKTGHIFRCNDPEDLAGKITLFFDGQAESGSSSEEYIKDYANIMYSWESIGAELTGIYMRLSGREGGAP